MLGKITLAPAPVDMQIFDQKRGDYHSQPIVHKAGGVQFTHSCIDNGETGFTLTPGLEIIAVVIPVQISKLFQKRSAKNLWKMIGDMGEKIAPVQLPQQGMFAAELVGNRIINFPY